MSTKNISIPISNEFVMNAVYQLSEMEQSVLWYLIAKYNPEEHFQGKEYIVSIREIKSFYHSSSGSHYGSFGGKLVRLITNLGKGFCLPSDVLVEGHILPKQYAFFDTIIPHRKKNREVDIHFKFGEGFVQNHLHDLSRYVRVYLQELKGLNSKHSMRILPMLKSHFNKLKAVVPVPYLELSVDELKTKLGAFTYSKSKGVQFAYPRFNTFREKVIEYIQKDISDNTSLSLGVSYKRKGKKVTHVGFHITDSEKKSKAGFSNAAITQEDIDGISLARVQAFKFLIEKGVQDSIAFRTLLTSIPDNPSSPIHGYEDKFVEFCWDHFVSKNPKYQNAGTFVIWWTKNKSFSATSNKFGGVWGKIVDQVHDYKRSISRKINFEQRNTARFMTSKDFHEYRNSH